MYTILSVKKASNKISAQRDLSAVKAFLKAKLKRELDIALAKKEINIINSKLLTEANALVESVVNKMDDIKNKIKIKKEKAVKAKKLPNAELSPDENYAIEMESIQDIKKNGLNRKLKIEEKTLLKNAEIQFKKDYSDELKSIKHRVNTQHMVVR